MKYIILCPAVVVSGGQELAHQMCSEIRENGYDAYMYYTFRDTTGPADVPCQPEFEKYDTSHICSHDEADKEENVVIVPEGFTDRAYTFKKAIIAIWWMSVDNYYRDNENNDINELDSIAKLHMAQSEYAHQHLLEHGVSDSKIMMLTDYINDDYGQFILPSEYRKNIVLYNPKKGLENLIPVIKRTEDLDWRPLYKLTREEMIVLMELAKVYIDFGNHPGKDRIPREAAICGCCVITNRSGSAAYSEDVDIPEDYKFEMDERGYDKAAGKIVEIFNNYEKSLIDFDKYREKIKNEKSYFKKEVVLFLNRATSLK